jgi:hypothetical protein
VDDAELEINPAEFGGEVEIASRVRIRKGTQHMGSTRLDLLH